MIDLNPNEQIIKALHRHWILIIGEIIIISFFIFAPLIAALFAADFIKETAGNFYYLAWFLLSIYLLLAYLTLFIIWMDYYLDIWIVTNERILDIEHSGIFKREVSEFPIRNVQDVTIEIPGMIPSILKYGNLLVQTAGERNFKVMQIPYPEEAKDIIIEYAQKAQNDNISSKIIVD